MDYRVYPQNARTKQNFEYGILTILRAEFFSSPKWRFPNVYLVGNKPIIFHITFVNTTILQ